MGKSLYLEAASGIAGDMFVAALLDLGADRKALDKAISSIPAKGFTVEIGRVQKAGIDCCDFNVILDKEHENHDHDMAYLYGPLPEAREAVHEEHHHHHEEEGHHHEEEEHHCHCHEEGHHHEEEEHHCHCHEEGHHQEEEEPHCHCHEEGHHQEEAEHH